MWRRVATAPCPTEVHGGTSPVTPPTSMVFTLRQGQDLVKEWTGTIGKMTIDQ